MSDANRARLAVIIVSFNTRDLLRECLRSLLLSVGREATWLTTDIIVVDNASSDGSAEMVATEFPQVHMEALAQNRGFTGGNNRALEMTGLIGAAPSLPSPDFVLLLNPDTLVVDDAPAQMVRFLQSSPLAGICGAALRYGDGRFQHGAFAFPGVAQVALDLFPLKRIALGARLYEGGVNGRYAPGLWQAGRPFRVDFVLGAALMARAAVIQQIGGLDDGYFMYCEEMDFCLRAAEAGWETYAVPAAQIIHFEGQSSRQVRWTTLARLWRSRLRFYRLHAGHFAPGTPTVVRLLMRVAMTLEARLALRRFARGQNSGVEAGAEIAARHAVARLKD